MTMQDTGLGFSLSKGEPKFLKSSLQRSRNDVIFPYLVTFHPRLEFSFRCRAPLQQLFWNGSKRRAARHCGSNERRAHWPYVQDDTRRACH